MNFKEIVKDLSARVVGVAAVLALYFGAVHYLILQGYL
jgi:hypothetical protein